VFHGARCFAFTRGRRGGVRRIRGW
jgi:hypothetical protein